MFEARRTFHIGDVLAVTLHCADLSPRGARGVRALYEYLAARDLTDEEIAESADQFCEALLWQHPALYGYSREDVPTREFLAAFLARRAAELGEYLPVFPLPEGHAVRTATRGREAMPSRHGVERLDITSEAP